MGSIFRLILILGLVLAPMPAPASPRDEGAATPVPVPNPERVRKERDEPVKLWWGMLKLPETAIPGTSYRIVEGVPLDECRAACVSDMNCRVFTHYGDRRCFLKREDSGRRQSDKTATSGKILTTRVPIVPRPQRYVHKPPDPLPLAPPEWKPPLEGKADPLAVPVSFLANVLGRAESPFRAWLDEALLDAAMGPERGFGLEDVAPPRDHSVAEGIRYRAETAKSRKGWDHFIAEARNHGIDTSGWMYHGGIARPDIVDMITADPRIERVDFELTASSVKATAQFAEGVTIGGVPLASYSTVAYCTCDSILVDELVFEANIFDVQVAFGRLVDNAMDAWEREWWDVDGIDSSSRDRIAIVPLSPTTTRISADRGL